MRRVSGWQGYKEREWDGVRGVGGSMRNTFILMQQLSLTTQPTTGQKPRKCIWGAQGGWEVWDVWEGWGSGARNAHYLSFSLNNTQNLPWTREASKVRYELGCVRGMRGVCKERWQMVRRTLFSLSLTHPYLLTRSRHCISKAPKASWPKGGCWLGKPTAASCTSSTTSTTTKVSQKAKPC